MIRFVDLTEEYWNDPADGWPVCAFLDTVTDQFIEVDGQHLFAEDDMLAGISDERLRERCRALVPDGFWEGK